MLPASLRALQGQPLSRQELDKSCTCRAAHSGHVVGEDVGAQLKLVNNHGSNGWGGSKARASHNEDVNLRPGTRLSDSEQLWLRNTHAQNQAMMFKSNSICRSVFTARGSDSQAELQDVHLQVQEAAYIFGVDSTLLE